MLPLAKCRGCHRDIIWGRNVKTGNLIPLDATAPVYHVIEDKNDGVVTIERQLAMFVSHFATCTKVERFKRPKESVNVPRGNGAGTNGTGEQEES